MIYEALFYTDSNKSRTSLRWERESGGRKYEQKNGRGRSKRVGGRRVSGLFFLNQKFQEDRTIVTNELKKVSAEFVSHWAYICLSSVRPRVRVPKKVRVEMVKNFLFVSFIENSLSILHLVPPKQDQTPLLHTFITPYLSTYRLD